jgi:hypothetical protein
MRLGLVFTDDWELFGNGAGDFQQRQVIPAHRFMAISEKYEAKYTFMAEVGQYWGFKRWAPKYPELEKGVKAWEETLKLAISRGHDVQLHLHPQWEEATYDGRNWQLNLQYWNIATLPPEKIRSLIRRGKTTLEELLRPVKSEYECCCFRSGSWMVQPSHPLIEIMLEEGIVCDASVVCGDRLSHKYGEYDFTTAYSNLFPWWVDHNDINRREISPGQQAFLEIPIYTEIKRYPTLYPHIIKKFRDRTLWIREIYPPSTQPGLQKDSKAPSPSIISKVWKLIGAPRTIMFDHGQLSANHLLAMIKRIRRRISHLREDKILPVMSISHSKVAYFYDEFEKFLKNVRSLYGEEIVFMGMAEANQYLRKLKSLPTENKNIC